MIQDNKTEIFKHLFRAVEVRNPYLLTILELGPWNGADTETLLWMGYRVHTIEGKQSNLELVKKRLKSSVYSPSMYKCYLHNLEDVDNFPVTGPYDYVLCCGILYHLPRPWTLIKKLTTLTDRIIGWTHVADPKEDIHQHPRVVMEGRVGRFHKEPMEGGKLTGGPWDGLSPLSFWYLIPEFEKEWRKLGWNFEWLTEPAPHKNGGYAGQFFAYNPSFPFSQD